MGSYSTMLRIDFEEWYGCSWFGMGSYGTMLRIDFEEWYGCSWFGMGAFLGLIWRWMRMA